jgi:hypothetical protein
MTGRKPNADAPPRLPADSLAWSLHAAAGVVEVFTVYRSEGTGR